MFTSWSKGEAVPEDSEFKYLRHCTFYVFSSRRKTGLDLRPVLALALKGSVVNPAAWTAAGSLEAPLSTDTGLRILTSAEVVVLREASSVEKLN